MTRDTIQTVKRELLRRQWTAVVALVLLGGWEGYARFLNPRGDAYFPRLTFTIRETWEHRQLVWEGTVVTLQSAVVAFSIAILTGVALGVLVSELGVFRQLSMPVIVFAYSLPHAILAPLFIIWFGRDLLGVGLFGAWVAFFPVFINTVTGMASVSEEFRYFGQLLGTTRWQMLRYIKFWLALPHIASSTRIAVQLSIIGVIVAEFLATGSGLGFLIVWAVQRARLGLAFGTIVVIMIVAILFYTVVSLSLDRLSPKPE